MAALFSAEEIIEITGARLAAGMFPDEAAEIHSDTRTLPEGAWFIALSGPEFDGHDFLGDAFSQGALGCIVAERPSYAIASTSFPLIAVDDTIEALIKLARNWRRRLSPKVVVVLVNKSAEVGQVGRICYQELESKYRAEYWTLARESTGVVLNTVLDMDDATQAVVVEISPVHNDHMQACLAALQPNVLVVASEGFDHYRMSSAQGTFRQGLNSCFNALDVKKCKLIIASKDQDIIDGSNVFQGQKLLLEGGDDPDEWAGKQAALQV